MTEIVNTFWCTFYKTTPTGKHLFIINTQASDDDKNRYIKSFLKKGNKVPYLTQSDQVTLILDNDGNKILLAFGLDKPISKLHSYQFPMVESVTGSNKGSINVDTLLAKFTNENIREFGASMGLDFCISEARATLASEKAQAYQQESDDSESDPTPETPDNDVIETEVNSAVKDILDKATKKKTSK